MIKKFWYESNACWGYVKSLQDLNSKIELQLAAMSGIDTIDDFLDLSKQAADGSDNYGTRMEHTGDKSLRDFLTEHEFDFSSLNRSSTDE